MTARDILLPLAAAFVVGACSSPAGLTEVSDESRLSESAAPAEDGAEATSTDSATARGGGNLMGGNRDGGNLMGGN
ncbi:MAG TPA: hypothetical protein VE871_16640 [Longimicrobium sp.]|nr:hypothetical protein [Longimicrobium sp.]